MIVKSRDFELLGHHQANEQFVFNEKDCGAAHPIRPEVTDASYCVGWENTSDNQVPFRELTVNFMAGIRN
jgi:hypothetical protein